jgi:hypothetical protein
VPPLSTGPVAVPAPAPRLAAPVQAAPPLMPPLSAER